MTDEVQCASCQAVISPANIDRQRELATCTHCGRLTDLRRAPAAPSPRARPPVQLPFGMSMTTMPDRLIIRRRWLRQKHWLFLCVIGAAGACVAYLWLSFEPSVWLVLGTLLFLSWNYNLAAMFVNTTVISADADGVSVQHGPIPSLFARNAAAVKSQARTTLFDDAGPRVCRPREAEVGTAAPTGGAADHGGASHFRRTNAGASARPRRLRRRRRAR